MLVARIVHREIIEEDVHESRYVFAKNFCDDTLKCRMRRFKPEHHHYGYEYATVRHECRLLLIVRMYTILIIPVEAV